MYDIIQYSKIFFLRNRGISSSTAFVSMLYHQAKYFFSLSLFFMAFNIKQTNPYMYYVLYSKMLLSIVSVIKRFMWRKLIIRSSSIGTDNRYLYCKTWSKFNLLSVEILLVKGKGKLSWWLVKTCQNSKVTST